MLTVVLAGLRTRGASLLGGFTALALGVCLLTVTGLGLAAVLRAPDRPPVLFADSAVVVQGQDRLSLEVRRGPGTGVASAPLDRPQPVDAELLRELRARWTVTVPPSLDGPGGPVAVGVAGPADEVRAVVATFTDAAQAEAEPAAPPRTATSPSTATSSNTAASARVLTGPDRRAVDPDATADARALVSLTALLGTAGGVTAFVSVFVVASTFAFTVALRRREYGLLRTAGATPGQIRRMLLGEAALLGVVASATGCLLGGWAAPVLGRVLVAGGVAPSWLTVPAAGSGVGDWPYQVAFWTGPLVALTGALAASRRAGRTGAAAVLRDADVDADVLPRGRALWGAGLLLGGLGLLVWTYATEPAELLKRKTYVMLPMPLIAGAALLSPALVRPLARALRLPGAIGSLVRANTSAAVRRTAAVAAPVLATVALTGTLLGSASTVAAARAEEAPGTAGTAVTSVFVRDGAEALVKYEAHAVADPARWAQAPTAARLPVVAGSLGDLDDGSIVVNEEFAQRGIGDRVDVWLADGSGPVRLRVAAVLARGAGGNGPFVTPRNAPGAPQKAEAPAPPHTAAPTSPTSPASPAPATSPASLVSPARLGLILVLGIALAYTVIGLANTLLMATSARGPELAALRLAGATRAQILRTVAGESLLAVGIGAALGIAVTAVGIGGLTAALAALSAPLTPTVPWSGLALATGVCAVVATAAALLPAWRSTR
ncbi:FtsX-like permease family protein [Streptomyces sp. NPDC090025]|uniref:ABC transporter permease n=1 Tax=Streptomyces sp. NPDC090025 TaxID=3365922 RepID=UPI003835B270